MIYAATEVTPAALREGTKRNESNVSEAAAAHGLGAKRLATFLKAHRYSNRTTPAQLVQRLRSAPAGRAGEFETRTPARSSCA